jgi:enoyl-CoA hydratase
MNELLVEQDDGLLVLTINRPETRNAFTFEIFEGLDRALEQASTDHAVRAVIVTGAGAKAFSAGMDLTLLFEQVTANPSGSGLRKVQVELQQLFTGLERLEKPVIAAIEGACVGGGLELALACDLRVASSDAKFGLPELRIGMIPDLGGTSRLARMVGPSVAKEWIFTGRLYPSVRALELGLVNELVVPGDALLRAKHLAREIIANGPGALAWAKRIIDRGPSLSLEESLELEQHAMRELLPGPELKEGVLAFFEKRAPRFKR